MLILQSLDWGTYKDSLKMNIHKKKLIKNKFIMCLLSVSIEAGLVHLFFLIKS